MATDLEEHNRVVSPAYQQIHLEQDKAKGVVRAFLVGQSGPHHFSAAFEVAERPHGAVIDVDVADRCRAPVEYLAATYAIEPSPGVWSSEDALRVRPRRDGRPRRRRPHGARPDVRAPAQLA